jgi:hypothetical protein
MAHCQAMRRQITIFGFGMLTLVFVGCHSVRRGEPISGLVPMSDPAVQRGRTVFMHHCHQCHPNGEGGLGPSLNDKPAPKFLMKTQVRLGLGVMPSFRDDKITSSELDDLMQYILSLRRSG